MTFPRPSLLDLRRRVAADVSSSLGRGPALERSVLFQLSQAVAGATHSQYGYLDWIFDQTFPDTADAEALDRWGRLYGVPRRAAAFAVGTAVFSGPDGAVVPEGVRLIREDSAVLETIESGIVADGSAEVAIRAIEAGLAGNTLSGVQLRLAAALEGFQPLAPIGAGGVGGGADVESDDELRGRLTSRLRSPGQGGNAADYVRWALEVPGVTRAWCHPVLNGLGTVGVSIMRDDDPDPYLAGAALAQVQSYIDERRPVGMIGVEVFAPTPVEVDLELRVEPDTAQIRELVTRAIEDLLFREGGPSLGQEETILPLSRISEAISSAAGERSHEIVTPTDAPRVTRRELLTLGEITWS